MAIGSQMGRRKAAMGCDGKLRWTLSPCCLSCCGDARMRQCCIVCLMAIFDSSQKCLFKVSRLWGWGNGSVSKVFVGQTKRLEFGSQHPCTELAAACTCTLRAGKAEIKGYLWLSVRGPISKYKAEMGLR